MIMKAQLIVWMVAVATLVGCRSVDGPDEAEPLSSVALRMAATSVAPGATVDGKLTISMAPGWHTYGDPPGDSGMPPIIEFKLPKGWTYVRLPLPPTKTFKDGAGTANGYEGSVDVPFRLTAPKTAAVGTPVTIEITVQWLICKDVCVPKSDDLQTTLTIVKQ